MVAAEYESRSNKGANVQTRTEMWICDAALWKILLKVMSSRPILHYYIASPSTVLGKMLPDRM